MSLKKYVLAFLLFSLTQAFYAQSSKEILVLSAVVKDKVIPGAQVIFQKNGEKSIPLYSDQRGKVQIPAEYQDEADLTIIIKKDGYSTLVSKCPCGGLTYAISPVMEELDGMRIVLSWGSAPEDLDSHLSYQGGYVCYYQKDASQANLDVDDTDSYGPETITITKKIHGKKYVYAVHNYSNKESNNNANLSKISNAKVYVYIGNTLIRTYVPQFGKTGTVWIPFIIDENGNLVDVGDFKNATSWEGVRSILRDYRYDAANHVVDAASIQESINLNKDGERSYHAGNLEQSVAYYQDAIEENPRNGQAYSNLGLSFQKLGREAEALWANRKAIDLAEGAKANIVRASSYYNIARIYEQKGQWNDALNNFKLAKQHNQNPAYDKGITRMSAKVRS
ncbi:tetratricopeptide repeat protein [Flavobacterium terrae]|uniref:Tetratricopeptide repeat-containing protein n=1 Tax=Flavobacterium terrae TaxID=415425 RepID=A0A1M6B8K9_9FLAO|nr:tetratricopeptide repeat protein [Flavobacterium terrae]SHI45069.1 Tetratricopeptide repeat-containing protein [Flavobacterium terrae]